MPFDLRDALRGLRRDLGYTTTAVFTLALTIGATTAIFSIVNGVLLRPLAYRESHQLVALREVFVEIADRYPVLPLNGRHFEEWRSQSQTFDALAEYLPLSANLTGTGDALRIALLKTSGGLFDVLQTAPMLGRGLGAGDERWDAPDVAVIGHRLWRERFGGDPAIVGRALTLDGKPHTVVGVLPAGFQLPAAPRPSAAFELTPKVDAIAPLRLPVDLGWVGDFNHVAIGRLKRGVSVEQARADLDVIQGRIATRVSAEAGQPATMRALIIPLTEAVVGGARRGLVLLMGAIVAVLLIACANLANLSLTRATVRLRDAMIKTALGASRARLVGQLVTEQLIVAGAGGALGADRGRRCLRRHRLRRVAPPTRDEHPRRALGARASQVVGLVLRQTGVPVAVGAVAGGLAAIALGGVVASQLFEVRARDPLVIAATVLFVTGVGMLTCAVAARQGLSIDPAAALRDECGGRRAPLEGPPNRRWRA
jgi:predicted permease